MAKRTFKVSVPRAGEFDIEIEVPTRTINRGKMAVELYGKRQVLKRLKVKVRK